MDTIVKKIIASNKSCYFISPHFDDAAMSVGLLMSQLAKYTQVTVINIFTKAGEPPFTQAARSYMRQCGYDNANTLYLDRMLEDIAVLKRIAHRVINFDYPDALWRKRKSLTYLEKKFQYLIPEMVHLYPTYWLHMIKGSIALEDRALMAEIKTKLFKIVNNGIIFCPICVGKHVDHVITRTLCEELFDCLIYWSDYPYNIRPEIWGKQCINTFHQHKIFGSESFKLDLLRGYKTQYRPMFGQRGPTIKDEVIYFTDALETALKPDTTKS